MTKKKFAIATVLSLGLTLSACQPSGDKGSSADEIKALSAKLDSIDKKLDRMSAGQGRAKAPAPKRPTVGQLYKVDVSDDDAYRGAKDAKVTVVEASEFACPYCKLLAGATDTLLSQYDGDELKVVSKQFVVHPSLATQPALAACAASKQGKFSEYDQELWSAAWKGDERPQLVREGLADASLDSIATKLDLDMDRFHTDMKGSCVQVVARNRKEMATLGVNGTPAVYINGRYYGGPRTAEGLKAAVDKELEAANATLAKGGSVENYYDGLISKGKAQL
jgi:protein-disulfide isomerase